MSIKTIDISIADRFYTLHSIAAAQASAVNSNIAIENLAFSDSGEFLGGGNRLLLATAVNKNELIPSKNEFFEVIQKYIDYFYPMKLDIDDLGELHSDDILTARAPVNESTYVRRQIPSFETDIDLLVESLFMNEASGSTSSSTSAVSSVSSVSSDVVGYGLPYVINMNGFEVEQAAVSSRIKAQKSHFQGIKDALLNLSFTLNLGGIEKKIAIGKVFDPDAWKSFFRTPDIDINTIESRVRQIFRDDFPNANINVEVYTANELINLLGSQRKLDDKGIIRKKISAADYSITVLVTENDINRSNITKSVVATELTKAFGYSDKYVNGNKITEKDVIQIDNFQSLYRLPDIYKQMKLDDRRDKSFRSRSVTESLIAFLFEANISADDLDRIRFNLIGKYQQVAQQSKKVNGMQVQPLIGIAKTDDVKNFCLSQRVCSSDVFDTFNTDYTLIAWVKRPNDREFTMSDGHTYKVNTLEGGLGQDQITLSAIEDIFKFSTGSNNVNVKVVHADGKTSPIILNADTISIFGKPKYLGYDSLKKKYSKQINTSSGRMPECDQYPAVADIYLAPVNYPVDPPDPPTPQPPGPGPTPPTPPDPTPPDPTPPGPTPPSPSPSDDDNRKTPPKTNVRLFIVPKKNLKSKHERPPKLTYKDGNYYQVVPNNDQYDA